MGLFAGALAGLARLGVSEREVRGGPGASAGPVRVSGVLGSSVDRAQPVTAVEDVGPPERCCQQLDNVVT